MKKYVLTLAICLMTVVNTSCGGATNNTGNPAVTETQENKGTPDSGNGNEDTNKTADKGTQKGYLFKYGDVTVSVDQKASEVVDKLGTYTYYEAPSCAFNGLDKIYTYPSFEIDTYPEGDSDYVSAIIFKDDMVETLEGACIGMEKSKVVKLYGEPTETSGTLAVYSKDGMQLRFIYGSDDCVTSIQYMSGVLQ